VQETTAAKKPIYEAWKWEESQACACSWNSIARGWGQAVTSLHGRGSSSKWFCMWWPSSNKTCCTVARHINLIVICRGCDRQIRIRCRPCPCCNKHNLLAVSLAHRTQASHTGPWLLCLRLGLFRPWAAILGHLAPASWTCSTLCPSLFAHTTLELIAA